MFAILIDYNGTPTGDDQVEPEGNAARGQEVVEHADSAPSAADATAKLGIDQPRRGAVLGLLGLIDSLTLEAVQSPAPAR